MFRATRKLFLRATHDRATRKPAGRVRLLPSLRHALPPTRNVWDLPDDAVRDVTPGWDPSQTLTFTAQCPAGIHDAQWSEAGFKNGSGGERTVITIVCPCTTGEPGE